MEQQWPKLEVWRMSASRPHHLKASHPTLLEHLKYSGDIEYHLIESVLVKELSEECIAWGKNNGYKVHVINPAQGQGYAVWYYLNNVCNCPFALKWEDDFQAEVDIPLDDCVDLMIEYPHINQICFNKRETMRYKWCEDEYGERYKWMKEQRYFNLHGRKVPLVVKEKWWFGASLWRTEFIKPIFQYWKSNTHNIFNDQVILPMIRGEKNRRYSASEVEESVGCYIYGKTGDKRMAFHAGRGDSIWAGEFQKKMEAEGREVVGV